MKIFSENKTFGVIKFDLKISATVVEEKTWADTSLITIIFKEPQLGDPF